MRVKDKKKIYCIILFSFLIFEFSIVFVLMNINFANSFSSNSFGNNGDLGVSGDDSINILTPENKTYYDPMVGYYPATYGFEEGDLSDWINPNSPLDVAEVVPEKGGHNGVLHLSNYNPNLFYPETPEPYFQDTFPSKTNGVVELWHFAPDYSFLDKWDHVIAFAGGQLYVDRHNRYVWWTNAAGNVVLATNVIGKWNHIKFNLVNGILQISINNGTPIQVDSRSYINYIAFIEYWTREMWIDAIGYSWDSSYSEGDNKEVGLLLSYDSPFALNSFSYSLDGQ